MGLGDTTAGSTSDISDASEHCRTEGLLYFEYSNKTPEKIFNGKVYQSGKNDRLVNS